VPANIIAAVKKADRNMGVILICTLELIN